MMRRLFWIGVGVGVTVLVIHQGRKWYTQIVPEPAAGAVDTAVAVSRGVRRVWDDFSSGRSEAEKRLTDALIGDRDIDALKATAGERRDRLAARFAGTIGDSRFAEWADEPTEDPEDDDGYAF